MPTGAIWRRKGARTRVPSGESSPSSGSAPSTSGQSAVKHSGRISLSRGSTDEENTQSNQYQLAHADPSTGDVHEMRADTQPDTHDDEPYQINPKRHTHSPPHLGRAIR